MTVQNEDFRKIKIDDTVDLHTVFGSLDGNLARIRESTGTDVIVREDDLILRGGDMDRAEHMLHELASAAKRGETLDEQKLNYIVSLAEADVSYEQQDISRDVICFTTHGKPIRAKTAGQKQYVESIRKRDVFERLVDYVLLSNARIFSAKSITDYMKGQNITISVPTVIKYLGYLKEAYVIEDIPLYSPKAKAKLNYYY